MDPLFNQRFARNVTELISKMDDDSAEMFTRLFVYDTLHADIAANRRTIDRHVNEIVKSIREDISKGLIRRGDEQSMAAATLVGAVSKSADNPNTDWWDARDNRGRWAKKNAKNSKVALTWERSRDLPNRGRPDNARLSMGGVDVVGALNSTGKQTTAFQEKWNSSSDLDASTNARTYRRVEAGSKLLRNSNDPRVALAGRAGEFAGQYGPEAEKVVGPAMRRAAYRYRGTERRPDPRLSDKWRDATLAVGRANGMSVNDPKFSPEMKAEGARIGAISYLEGRLPKKELSSLQQESGKIPPSEGVIINADGKIITQAVGYMDDHYLPFNLKNLKGLQGGHYVRTRSAGGLTTEDIYTGLISGARSVTVVSRSGTFTVQFDDDFRGGRRYNDKAHQMVGRYGKILDAVKSEQVSRRGLTLEEKARIRDEVETELGEWADRSEIETEIKRRGKDELSNPQLTKDELQEIELHAMTAYPDNEKKRRMARSELIDAAMENKSSNKYRLDGAGYASALDAMAEQFPYYIANVHYVTSRTGHEASRGKSSEMDSGYVKARYIRPEGAKEGYFDESINGRGKVSADRLNYANWPNNPENRKQAATTDTEVNEEQAASAAKGAAKPSGKKEQRQAMAAAMANLEAKKTLHQLADLVNKNVEGVSAQITAFAKDADYLDTVSQADVDKMMRDIEDHLSTMESATGERAAGYKEKAKEGRILFQTYKAQKMATSGSFFSIKDHRLGSSPEQPYNFESERKGLKHPSDPYVSGSDPKDYESEWAAVISGTTGRDLTHAVGGSLDIDKVTDKQLQVASKFYGQVAAAAQGKSTASPEETLIGSGITDVLGEVAGLKLAAAWGTHLRSANTEKVNNDALRNMVAAERLRRIKSARGDRSEPISVGQGQLTKVATVPGEVVSSTTKADPKKVIATLEKNAERLREHGQDDRADTLDVLRTAVESGDRAAIDAAIDEMDKPDRDMWEKHV